MPEARPLSLLRRDIDRRPQRLKQILCESGLRKEFLGGVANDEKKAVKKFVDGNAESALKTKPKVSQVCSFQHHSPPFPCSVPPIGPRSM